MGYTWSGSRALMEINRENIKFALLDTSPGVWSFSVHAMSCWFIVPESSFTQTLLKSYFLNTKERIQACRENM